MKKIIIVGIICLLLLIACFSPWRGGDFGTFTIITGSGDNSRTALGWNNVYDSGELVHDIFVIDSAGKDYSQKGIKGSQAVPFTVTSGSCKISVLAYLLEGEEKSQNLQAVGSRTVNINPGKNSAVTISMGEPNGEGYYKVTFKFDNKTINRYISEGEKVTIPEYYYLNCKKSIDAGLYNELFYDDKLIVNDKNVRWTNNGEPFIFVNGSHEEITDNITLTGEWKKLIPFPTLPTEKRDNLIADAINEQITQGGDYTLLLDNDISGYFGIEFDFATNLVLIGKETTRTLRPDSSEKGPIFVLQSNVKLTLGKNITLLGNDNNTDSLVKVDNGNTLTMLDGSKITGNIYPSQEGLGSLIESKGGGVYVSPNGTFTMTGGSITDNYADKGGGVYVDSDLSIPKNPWGKFDMSGGTISGNTARNGAGVYTYGIFTILANSSKVTISNNEGKGGTAQGEEPYGGGVYVFSQGTFNMQDGTIEANKATRGGGVCVSCWGTFKKTGGTIIGIPGNPYTYWSTPSWTTVAAEGSAVYVCDPSSLSLYFKEIDGTLSGDYTWLPLD